MASSWTSGSWNTSSSTAPPQNSTANSYLPAGTGSYAASSGLAPSVPESSNLTAILIAHPGSITASVPLSSTTLALESLPAYNHASTSTVWTTVLARLTRNITLLPPASNLTIARNTTITQFTTVTATQKCSNGTSLRQRRRVRKLEPRAAVTWLPNTKNAMELNKRSFTTTQPTITKLNCTHLDHAESALNTTLTTAIKYFKRDPRQNILPNGIANSANAAPTIIVPTSAKAASLCRVAGIQQTLTEVSSVSGQDIASILSHLQAVPSTLQSVPSELTTDMATATTTLFGSTTVVLVVTETAKFTRPSTSVEDVETTALPVGTTSTVDADTTTSLGEYEPIPMTETSEEASMTSTSSIVTTTESIESPTTSLSSFTSPRMILPSSNTLTPNMALAPSSNSAQPVTSTAIFVSSSTTTADLAPSESAKPSLPAKTVALITGGSVGGAALILLLILCWFYSSRRYKKRKNGRSADLPIHLQAIPHNPYRVEPTLPAVNDRGPDYPYIGARSQPVLPDRGPDHLYMAAGKSLSATNSNAPSSRPRNVSPSLAALNSQPAPRTTLYPSDSASQLSRPASSIRPSVVISPPMPAVPELSALTNHNDPYRVGVREMDGGDKVSRMDYGVSQDGRERGAASALSTVFPSGVPRESYFATDTVLSDDPFKRGGR